MSMETVVGSLFLLDLIILFVLVLIAKMMKEGL